MSEKPLWSDERIDNLIRRNASMLCKHFERSGVLVGQTMREEFEAYIAQQDKLLEEYDRKFKELSQAATDRRIAELEALQRVMVLEAQISETWQPVVDLEEYWANQYQKPIFVYVYKELLILEDDESEECMSVKIPTDFSFCRKATTLAAEPGIKERI